MAESRQYQVYLSYGEADEIAAQEIERRLRDTHGVQSFLRTWSVVPGTMTQPAQEEGLTSSDAFAVLIGAGGLRDWQQIEVYSSIQQRVETEASNFPVIPVYLPGVSDAGGAAVPPRLRLYEPVRFRSLDDGEALRRLARGVLGQPPGEEPPADIPSPFPGLDPFREEMAPYFGGRETEIDELQALLDAAPYVIVIGPSGSGKSSLVLAGLLPKLRGTQANPSRYLIHRLTPGAEPLQALAQLFAGEPGDPRRDQLAATFAGDTSAFAREVQALLKRQPAHVRSLLLVVDQFEELFTLCDDQSARVAFVENLLHASEPGMPTKIVFTLRSEFYSHLFAYGNLVEPVRHYPVQSLAGERLRQAIEHSARVGGLFYERGLVDALLRDAEGAPGILPLVQYTLRLLFDRRSGRWLTLDAYNALGRDVDPSVGGLPGVITGRAEAAIRRLEADPRFSGEDVEPIMRRILLRLVQVGENSPTTRQQVPRHAFFWTTDTPRQRELLEEALNLLIEERLLTTDSEWVGRTRSDGNQQPNAEPHLDRENEQVNLSHEVIIRVWKRLSTWVDERKEDLLTRRRVEEAAREWERSGRHESLLYRGVQLQKALEWQKRRI